MVKEAQQLFKNINFVLRLAECITCLIGIIILINGRYIFGVWSMHGWFLISLAYVFIYIFEDTLAWLEIIFLIAYFIMMLITVFTHLHWHSLFPVIAAAVLIAFDLAFLVKNKKNELK